MASREELEDWVDRWLKVNREAEEAGDWIEAAPISADEKRRVCHDNAVKLLGL